MKSVTVFNSLNKVIACNATDHDVIILPYFGIIPPFVLFVSTFDRLCEITYRFTRSTQRHLNWKFKMRLPKH